MKKLNNYKIEYLNYDENYIPFRDQVEIKADNENLAIIEFRMLYGGEILNINMIERG